jgi:hypothetical protein
MCCTKNPRSIKRLRPNNAPSPLGQAEPGAFGEPFPVPWPDAEQAARGACAGRGPQGVGYLILDETHLNKTEGIKES